MSVNFIIIGDRIRKIRQKRKLSQANLAEYTDLSVTYICHIETGKRQASLESLIRISNVLGVTLDFLLAGNQESDPTSLATEFAALFDDCTNYERQIMLDIASAAKDSLRKNKQSTVPDYLF